MRSPTASGINPVRGCPSPMSPTSTSARRTRARTRCTSRNLLPRVPATRKGTQAIMPGQVHYGRACEARRSANPRKGYCRGSSGLIPGQPEKSGLTLAVPRPQESSLRCAAREPPHSPLSASVRTAGRDPRRRSDRHEHRGTRAKSERHVLVPRRSSPNGDRRVCNGRTVEACRAARCRQPHRHCDCWSLRRRRSFAPRVDVRCSAP